MAWSRRRPGVTPGARVPPPSSPAIPRTRRRGCPTGPLSRRRRARPPRSSDGRRPGRPAGRVLLALRVARLCARSRVGRCRTSGTGRVRSAPWTTHANQRWPRRACRRRRASDPCAPPGPSPKSAPSRAMTNWLSSRASSGPRPSPDRPRHHGSRYAAYYAQTIAESPPFAHRQALGPRAPPVDPPGFRPAARRPGVQPGAPPSVRLTSRGPMRQSPASSDGVQNPLAIYIPLFVDTRPADSRPKRPSAVPTLPSSWQLASAVSHQADEHVRSRGSRPGKGRTGIQDLLPHSPTTADNFSSPSSMPRSKKTWTSCEMPEMASASLRL